MTWQNVPTKIDLYTDNLVVSNAQDFRIAPRLSIWLYHFIGYNDFIVMFYEPQKVELLTLPSTWPAPLEVSFAIKAHIEWAGKSEILCKMPLKKFPVAGCKSFVRSLC